VQKNLLANTLGGLIDEGFIPTAALTNSTVDNWFLAIGFGLQIYFDFASYSNMAIGAAQLMGIKLPENFRHPYHAGTPPEFWTRWHMTLSRWIRDYLFFPINAKYAGARLPLYASLIGIMGLVGLWHGAGWGFIVWGLLHGVYLVLFRIWDSLVTNRPRLKASAAARLAWRAFTLVAVTAAWVPFRAGTLGQAGRMLGSMFGRPRLDVSYGVNSYLIVALIAGYAAIEPWLSARWDALLAKSEAGNRDLWLRYALRPVLYAIGLFLFLIFDDQDRAFIYFQF
jgi:alginate O-acetyltransferase complex protein AlgI